MTFTPSFLPANPPRYPFPYSKFITLFQLNVY